MLSMRSCIVLFIVAVGILREALTMSSSSGSDTSLDSFDAYYRVIRECFDENRVTRIGERNINTVLLYNSTEDPIISVDNWIDKTDAVNLLVLADCVKIHCKHNFKNRPFDLKGYGGGNNVTFLNEILPLVFPDVMSQITSVAGAMTDTLGWRPHPSHLGIRCVELLEYETGGELKYHIDTDSTYTLSILISSKNDFKGGSLAIMPYHGMQQDTLTDDKHAILVSPSQYGGVIFDSQVAHSITPITEGKRIVLVIEFWPFEDSEFNEARPHIDLKKHLPKIPSIVRVPITEPTHAEKNILSSSIDKRDMFVFLVGIVAGLIISLLLLVVENRKDSENLRNKQKRQRDNSKSDDAGTSDTEKKRPSFEKKKE